MQNEMKNVVAVVFFTVLGMAAMSLDEPSQPSVLEVCPSGCPYSTIQEAIDAAPPGGIISIGEGTYYENLRISKGLVLRGVGPEVVQIVPADPQRTTLSISSRAPNIQVTIDDLPLVSSVLGTRPAAVTVFGGKLALNRSHILGRSGTGVYLVSAEGLITDSQFFGGANGLVLSGVMKGFESHAVIQRTRFEGTVASAVLLHYGRATIEESFIFGTKIGGAISVGAGSYVTIRYTQISRSSAGVSVQEAQGRTDKAEAILIENQIFANDTGLWIGGSAQVLLQENEIFENERGVVLVRSAQVTLQTNRIHGNQIWGIALWQQPCFETNGEFTGKVSGRDNEVFENGEGDLCPEDYPWPEGFTRP